jgi:hypothetical protein
MTAAKNLGLSVAPVETILADERPVLVADTLDRLPAAIAQATEDLEAVPDSLPELVTKRVEQP